VAGPLLLAGRVRKIGGEAHHGGIKKRRNLKPTVIDLTGSKGEGKKRTSTTRTNASLKGIGIGAPSSMEIAGISEKRGMTRNQRTKDGTEI